MPHRLIGSCVGLTAVCGLLGGCAAPTNHYVGMSDLGEPRVITTLGAGDSLGRAVYVNDLILASGGHPSGPAFTDADELQYLRVDE